MMREKIMWLIILAVSILAAISALLYLSGKVRRTGIFDFASKPSISRILALVAVIAVVVIVCLIFDITNAIVVFIHIAVFMLIGDLVCLVVNRSFGVTVKGQVFDLAAFIVCLIYLGIAWHLMHGMWETDYSIKTEKPIGTLRVAQISDSHVGSGFDGKGFGERLARIQESDPDILVITGDFVDDGTTKQDMIDACAALGNFKTRYGVYFCFGNHDRGYYSESRRGYGADDLIAELEKNNVTVLQDQSVLCDDRFYVIGRHDYGFGQGSRMTAEELTVGLDKDKYMIVLDHQPTDYEAESAAGMDLVLSGHTHGGQLWPLEYIYPIISENDIVHGHEHIGKTDFIVTDGISDWAVKFRTGCRSEYVIIDIEG